jgi:hypothetical protein
MEKYLCDTPSHDAPASDITVNFISEFSVFWMLACYKNGLCDKAVGSAHYSPFYKFQT